MKKVLDTASGSVEFDFRNTSKHKIKIKIAADGSVVVYAPRYVNFTQVEEFVNARAEWIISNSRRLHNEYNAIKNSKLDKIYILGVSYPIVQSNTQSSNIDVTFSNGVVFLYGEQNKALKLLYKKIECFAKEYLSKKFFEFKAELNIREDISIQVKNVKSWWGCYYPKQKLIKLSLRLITRDVASINAVICHELAHIGELNHQASFYSKLLAYCPNYHAYKRRLKNSKYNIMDNFIFGIKTLDKDELNHYTK